MNQLDTAASTTPNVALASAVERLYGSAAALDAALDGVSVATPDVWHNATAIDAPGTTGAAMRYLWSGTFDQLGDRERDIIELALSADDTPAREAARELATQAYMGVARTIAAAHVRHTGDDGRQVALLGMWQGFREYNPAKHTRPLATIQRNVLRALSDAHAARFGMTIPEPQRLAYAKANAAHPEDIYAAAEAAPDHGLSAETFWHIYRVLHMHGSVSSDGTITTGLDSGDINATGPDYAPQPMISPLVALAEEPNPVQAALVEGLLASLTDREREVVALRFGLDDKAAHTEDEAAAALALTPRRVRQIQAAALAKLRPTLGAE